MLFKNTSRHNTQPRELSWNGMGSFTWIVVVGALRVFPGGNQVGGLPPAPSQLRGYSFPIIQQLALRGIPLQAYRSLLYDKSCVGICYKHTAVCVTRYKHTAACFTEYNFSAVAQCNCCFMCYKHIAACSTKICFTSIKQLALRDLCSVQTYSACFTNHELKSRLFLVLERLCVNLRLLLCLCVWGGMRICEHLCVCIRVCLHINIVVMRI